MDVYVVLDQVRDEPGKVLGAATDLPGAQAIADSAASGRSAWTDALHTGKLARDAGDGWQEIVRVPLAGMVEAGELSTALADQVRAEAMMQPVDYATEISDIGSQFGAP